MIEYVNSIAHFESVTNGMAWTNKAECWCPCAVNKFGCGIIIFRGKYSNSRHISQNFSSFAQSLNSCFWFCFDCSKLTGKTCYCITICTQWRQVKLPESTITRSFEITPGCLQFVIQRDNSRCFYGESIKRSLSGWNNCALVMTPVFYCLVLLLRQRKTVWMNREKYV